MPTNMIKKDAREGKGTVKSLEKKWDKAKDAAGKKDGKQNWALTNYIYQRQTKGNIMPELNAATRLLATETQAEAINTVATEWIETGLEEVKQQMKVLSGIALGIIAGTLMWIVGGFFAIQQEMAAMSRSMGG